MGGMCRFIISSGLCALGLVFSCTTGGAQDHRPLATPTILASPTPSCLTSDGLLSQRPQTSYATKTCGAGGHQTNDCSTYRYFDNTCHNAANAGARRDFRTAGIVACTKRTQDHPDLGFTGHTFNWKATPVERCGYYKICLYNWGSACCYYSGTYTPGESPDLYEFDAPVSCAKDFCGDQWEDGVPKALAPGELVEDPGWMACVKQGAGAPANAPIGDLDLRPDASKQKTCRKCCADRLEGVYDLMAAYWTRFTCEGGQMDVVKTQTQAGFKRCNEECNKYFGPSPTPTPIATATQTPGSR